MNSDFEETVSQDFHSVLSSIGETTAWIDLRRYDDARERSMMLLYLDTCLHQLINLNDILCRMDTGPNEPDEVDLSTNPEGG